MIYLSIHYLILEGVKDQRQVYEFIYKQNSYLFKEANYNMFVLYHKPNNKQSKVIIELLNS